MLTVHNLSKSYNLNPILKDVTFSVNAGERVGLIGPNGSGKSTLLRIIVGEERPSGGHVTFTPAAVRVGYLAQGFAADPSLTLGELLHQTIGNPDTLEAELIQLGLALAAAPDRPDLLDAYDQTLSRLNATTPARSTAPSPPSPSTNSPPCSPSARSAAAKRHGWPWR